MSFILTYLSLFHILPRAVPDHSCPQLYLLIGLLLKENAAPSRGMKKSITIFLQHLCCDINKILHDF